MPSTSSLIAVGALNGSANIFLTLSPAIVTVGSAQTSVGRLFGGSCGDGSVTDHRGLELYGGHAAEAALAAAPVAGRLDLADDGDGEVVSGLLGLPGEDVVLQQHEERFHRGVVAGGRDTSHRSDEPVRFQGALVAA